jgi:flagellar motility protein MotE (MotC chaperone)
MALPLRMGLFAIIFVAVVMIGSRMYDMVGQIMRGEELSAVAPANAEEAAHDEKKADEKKPEEKKAETAPTPITPPPVEEKKAEAAPAAATPAAPPPAAAPAADAHAATPAPASAPDVTSAPAANPDDVLDGPDLTESEIEVLKHLSERRKELDKKAHEMDQRETLLNLTEQRVDKKITDLKQMQEDIRKVLGDADAQHVKQVASMVKIYETMKPKDAAKIFENMDMPTLVEVASRMKESKAAPVLAAMNAEKAKELSAALMTKKPLPQAP